MVSNCFHRLSKYVPLTFWRLIRRWHLLSNWRKIMVWSDLVYLNIIPINHLNYKISVVFGPSYSQTHNRPSALLSQRQLFRFVLIVCFVCVSLKRRSKLGRFVLGGCQRISEALKRIEYLEWISLRLEGKEGEAHHTIPFSFSQSLREQVTKPQSLTQSRLN